jgi:hypothetical protein
MRKRSRAVYLHPPEEDVGTRDELATALRVPVDSLLELVSLAGWVDADAVQNFRVPSSGLRRPAGSPALPRPSPSASSVGNRRPVGAGAREFC